MSARKARTRTQTVTQKRWGWTRGINDDIDITDTRNPYSTFAAPFISSVKQAKAVCAALNALTTPRPTQEGTR